jgi:UDP-N-acetylmuramoyl-L-alanyl-D-glutamate--2,6-diaminopimelate ligase
LRLSRLTEGVIGGAAGEVEITGLTADSRAVEPGFLFAALPGERFDGLDFLEQALARGAAAVLARPDPRLAALEVPTLVDGDPRHRLALLAARYFGRQPECVVAVTGTNGKTSVASFTAQLWTALGRRAATLGTLGVLSPFGTAPLAHTTPEPVTLHRHLKRLAEDGVECLAIEASSHGLDQRRLDGVHLDAAAFTHFGRDHLDYHEHAEAYLAAKLRLFDQVMDPDGVAVLNADLEVYERVRAVCERRRQSIVSYGGGGACDIRLAGIESRGEGQKLALEVFGIRSEIVLPLIGDFQALNALCALGFALATGAEREAALGALGRLEGVPGRLQRVALHPSGAQVFVDYSHKPEALASALLALRPYVGGQLLLVFGCGGNRDRGKRPEMGRIAERLADRIIVTDDNPRHEEPAAIRAEVLAGCASAREVGDRGEAIRMAVAELRAGDLLLIAGKGHESGQYVGDEVRPFDDAEAARAAVLEMGGTVA